MPSTSRRASFAKQFMQSRVPVRGGGGVTPLAYVNKFARPLGHWRVRSRKLSFLPLFLVPTREKAAPGDLGRRKRNLWRIAPVGLAPFGRPLARFFRFFEPPDTIPNFMFFSTQSKTTQIRQIVDTGRLQVAFLTQKSCIWDKFWHRFFRFYEKSENLEFDDPYMVLACFLH